MTVFRLARTKFANDLTGEGARLNGGRWNHKLTPCIYTSSSRSLAILEYTVNVNLENIPRALSIVSIEIPDDELLKLSMAQLPGDWATSPAPASSKDFGSALLKKAEYAVIEIPSAVIQQEYNYLLNPLFPGNPKFSLIEIQDFIYDVRLKK